MENNIRFLYVESESRLAGQDLCWTINMKVNNLNEHTCEALKNGFITKNEEETYKITRIVPINNQRVNLYIKQNEEEI